MPPPIADALPGFSGGVREPISLKTLTEGFISRLMDGLALLAPRTRQPKHDITIGVSADGYRLADRTSAVDSPAVPIAPGDMDGLALALAQRASGAASSKQRILIMIQDDLALCEHFQLQAMPRSSLDAVIGQRIEQQSPFPQDQTLGFSRTERHGADHIAVDLAIVEYDVLGPVLDAVRFGDSEVIGLGLFNESGLRFFGRPTWLATPPIGMRARWRALPDAARKLLLGGILVLCAYAASLSLTTHQADALRLDASAASSALAAATNRAEQGRAVEKARQESNRLVAVFEELSAQLPDGTWVEMFRLRDGALSIRFYAASASETRDLVSRLPGVASASIDGAIARDAQSKIERFTVIAKFADAGPEVTP